MKVLVTGGAGFIGSHLVDCLVKRGFAVHVIDDLSTGRWIPKGAAFTQGDVRCGLRPILERGRFDVLIHLAARVSVRTSVVDPVEDASVNVLGGVSALECAEISGVKRVLIASSGGTVYGDGVGRPFQENDPLEPRSPYGAAKVAVETYAASFGRARGLNVSCLRLANVYGPRQDPEGESGVVARFLWRALMGRPLELYGDGEQVRDFVYVTDVIAAFLAAMRGQAGIFNVGTGTGTSVNDLVRRIEALLGRRVRRHLKPAVTGETRLNVLDASRARHLLGWRPRVRLAKGLAATWRHLSRIRSASDAESSPKVRLG